jgi:kexin
MAPPQPPPQCRYLNVPGVWAAGHFGQTITVAIIDDGLDMDSLDLAANSSPEGSYDFNDHVALPKPQLADDRHGT